jgi:hypothetical protein
MALGNYAIYDRLFGPADVLNWAGEACANRIHFGAAIVIFLENRACAFRGRL